MMIRGLGLIQALRDQLGLRLVEKKGRVDFLVVEHVEKLPTEGPNNRVHLYEIRKSCTDVNWCDSVMCAGTGLAAFRSRFDQSGSAADQPGESLATKGTSLSGQRTSLLSLKCLY
jgi:hypothetical protein